MRALSPLVLALSLCGAAALMTGCGDKDDDTADEAAAPVEPYDLACGELTCEGSTEACWLPDCGSEASYRCEPLPEACLEPGAGAGCHSNSACEGAPEDGVICEQICG